MEAMKSASKIRKRSNARKKAGESTSESTSPQAQSTPLNTEKHVTVPSDSDGEDSLFLCTQDQLEVQWDWGPSPRKKGAGVKRKGGILSNKKKRALKVSPRVERILSRKKVVQKPRSNFPKLMKDLQALTQQIKEEQNKRISEEGNTSTENETNRTQGSLENDIQFLGHRERAHKQSSPSSSSSTDLKESTQIKKQNISYSALLDDDADECIVQCSQEIEQKECPSETLSLYSSVNERSHLQAKEKNVSLLNEGTQVPTVQKAKIPDKKDVIVNIPLENNWDVSDTQQLKSTIIFPDVPKKDISNSLNTRKNESFSALFEDDADDCIVLCSQEVEEKLNENKEMSKQKVKQVRSGESNELSKSGSASKHTKLNHLSNSRRENPNLTPTSHKKGKCQTFQTRAKVGSPKLNSSVSCFLDDSFDVMIENFTEEDIQILSQGVPIKKNVEKKHPCKDSLHPPLKQTGYIAAQYGDVNNAAGSKEQKGIVQERKVCGLAKKPQFKMKVPSVHMTVNSANYINNKVLSATTSVRPSEIMQGAILGTKERIHANSCINITAESSPQKFSPDEIEKKRLEAKKKLEEKKKLLMMNRKGKCHLPNGS